MNRSGNRTDGFTLIEVIVIITIGGLIAAMMVPFVGTALTNSAEPVNRVTDSFDVAQVIEKVFADYKGQLDRDALDLPTFKAGLSGFDENGVTVSGTFIAFPQDTGGYTDTSGSDGVFDPQDMGDTATDLLLVSASKNDHVFRMILGD